MDYILMPPIISLLSHSSSNEARVRRRIIRREKVDGGCDARDCGANLSENAT
jgi:hypothetical protein